MSISRTGFPAKRFRLSVARERSPISNPASALRSNRFPVAVPCDRSRRSTPARPFWMNPLRSRRTLVRSVETPLPAFPRITFCSTISSESMAKNASPISFSRSGRAPVTLLPRAVTADSVMCTPSGPGS